MSVDAPERIWAFQRFTERGWIIGDELHLQVDMSAEYVRADKLEELAAKVGEWEERFWKRDAQADRLLQERDKAEAALAEANRENEALREALSKIIAKDSYIDASPRGGRKVIYGDFAKIARNAGGKDADR